MLPMTMPMATHSASRGAEMPWLKRDKSGSTIRRCTQFFKRVSGGGRPF
jgi:hypothetical protein